MQATTNLPDEYAFPAQESLHAQEQTHAAFRWQGFWPIALVVLIGIAALAPAIWRGIPYGPDLPAHFRNTLSFNQSLQQGDPYQSWLAETNGGYGDPSMRLYPPALHYLFALAHAITGNWYAAALLAFTLLSVAGSLGVYFFARSFCTPRMAVWASLFYAFAPFHANELYQSALLAQYAGGAALAFAFAFTERILRRGRMQDVAGLALSFAFLIYTHIPLTMLGALALAVYALARIERKDFWQTFLKLALSAVLALMAGALYWTTLIAEHTWVKGDQVEPGERYNYALNFLFKSFSQDEPRNWWINIVALAMLALLWPTFIVLRSAASQEKKRSLRALMLLLIFSFLMATPLSLPLWKIIPKLGSIEFPWRWLAVTSIVGAVALAASIPAWMEKARTHLRPLALIVAGSILIALAFAVSHPMRGALFMARPQFDALLISLPGSKGFEDGLPVWAVEETRPMTSEVEAGERAVTVNSWASERRAFQVAAGEATEARVRTFYHPNWVAMSGDAVLQTRPDADGALLLTLPPVATSIELEFREPLRVRASAAASLIGLLFICALFVFSKHARQSSFLKHANTNQ